MRRTTFQKKWMLLMLRKTLCLGPANENDASSHACIVNGRIPWGPAHLTPPHQLLAIHTPELQRCLQ